MTWHATSKLTENLFWEHHMRHNKIVGGACALANLVLFFINLERLGLQQIFHYWNMMNSLS